MNTLIHADIFFFVTTIAVAVIASLLIVVIIYIVRILNDFRYISGVVRKETDLLAEDIEHIREEAKHKGMFAGLYAIISGLFKGSGERSKEQESGGAKKSKKTKK